MASILFLKTVCVMTSDSCLTAWWLFPKRNQLVEKVPVALHFQQAVLLNELKTALAGPSVPLTNSDRQLRIDDTQTGPHQPGLAC
jgi:hypothetical protein